MVAGFYGCGEITGLPRAHPAPVLQGLLILGEPRHLLKIEWSSPTHVPFAASPRPVDASLVDLWLVAPDGDSVPYAPTGRPGEFAALAAVSGGERYALSGTVAAQVVTAHVTLPGRLSVDQPAGDTLRHHLDNEVFFELPFAWRAPSAGSYRAWLQADGASHEIFIRSARSSHAGVFSTSPDTTGQLLILPPVPLQSDTARLIILAYDRTATAFFASQTRGNVRGVFGLFGAASKVEKLMIWE